MPDGEGHLSQGVLVEAHVEGRLLGAKILKLDADIMLMPAQAHRLAHAAALTSRPRSTAAVAARPRVVELSHARELLAEADVTIRQTAT